MRICLKKEYLLKLFQVMSILFICNHILENASEAADIFAPQVEYSVGSAPVFVTTGDFNGDGKIDVASANYYGTVSILLGKGDGSFQYMRDYDAAYTASGIVAGDFNNDGKIDLAIASINGNRIYVLLGNGDGSFHPGGSFWTGRDPYDIVTGDFNGDGKLDLATANPWSHNISVLLGNGDGTFLPYTDVGTYSLLYAWALTTGDFNNDGKTDLAVACSWPSGYVGILLGNGDGTFQPTISFATGSSPRAITAGDFNGDGKLDIATDNSDNTISILISNGDGSFQPKIDYTMPYSYQYLRAISVADFDGDQRTDLATINTTGNKISIILGNGDGTLQSAMDYGTGYSPLGFAAADFNNDGNVDVVVANSGGNTISVLLNITPRDTDKDGFFDNVDNCRYVYNPDQADRNENGIGDACDGDFDGDGIKDIVDNCASTYNTDQLDLDGDSVGDACDSCINDPENTCLDTSIVVSPTIREPVTISNGAGTASVTVEPGTITVDTTFTITGETNLSNFAYGSNQQVLGAIYTFAVTPQSNFVTPPGVTIILKYSQGTIPEGGVTEQNIDIYWYNPATQTWEPQYAAQDMATNTLTLTVSHFSIYAAIATENPIRDLIAVFKEVKIENAGIWTSLLTKLEKAYRHYEQGDSNAAKNVLEAFINELLAQSDKEITKDKAIMLIGFANELKDMF